MVRPGEDEGIKRVLRIMDRLHMPKFRAWDKDFDEMINLKRVENRYDFEDGKVLAFVVDGYGDFGGHEKRDGRPNWEIMRYSGLEDSEDIEVCAGDLRRGQV